MKRKRNHISLFDQATRPNPEAALRCATKSAACTLGWAAWSRWRGYKSISSFVIYIYVLSWGYEYEMLHPLV